MAREEIAGEAQYQLALSIEKESDDAAKVLSLLEESSTLGNGEAKYALATFFIHGKYVEKDIRIAIPLLKQAVESGVKEAMFDLGYAYEEGRGVRKDLRVAFSLYLQASLLGDLSSSREVARCLYWGIGVDKNANLYEKFMDAIETLEKKMD